MFGKTISTFIIFILLSGIATATGDEIEINKLLESGGNVTLESRVYTIEGPIYVPANTVLSGVHGTVIRVSDDIKKFFSPTVAVINCNDPHNIKIYGFTIDGNCQNLNSEWANSAPEHGHDQHRLIQLTGSSNDFGENVYIHDMVLSNSFSDGIYARLIDGITCSNNLITNTQHECIYYKACKNCKMLDNQMAAITSDGGRFDNCFNAKFQNNFVWKYDGSNNNGAYKGGANGVQAGDSGVSKGYDGRTNILHTTNIEITNNTFSDPGRKAILIDAGGQKPSTNVLVKDNIFIDTEGLERAGISIPDDISYENPPTIEQSENVFNSIFDILNFNFITSGFIGNKTIYVNGTLYDSSQAPKNVNMTLEQHELGNQSYTLLYGPSEGLTQVQVKYAGKQAVHTLMIGESRGSSIFYSNCSIWSGDIYRIGDSFYFDGMIEPNDIDVTCSTVTGSLKPDFKVVRVEQEYKGLFNNFIFLYLSILVVLLSIPVMVVVILFSKRF
jgi:hypothetical protein